MSRSNPPQSAVSGCGLKRFDRVEGNVPWSRVQRWNRKFPYRVEVKFWDADEHVRRGFSKGPAFISDAPEGTDEEAYAAVWLTHQEVPTPLDAIFLVEGEIFDV